MGEISQNIRGQVNNLLDKYGSLITLQRLDATTTDRYGYEDFVIEGTGTVKAVPSNYFKNRFMQEKYGDLREGELRMLIKAEDIIGTAWGDLGTGNMRAEFDGGTYDVRTEKSIYFQDLEIAKPIILTRRL